ncbi:FtsX-like permease family protein [Paraclostridium ghonii]|uniref:ABC transporter permease n=1 Tax=Paraclostridium ghonii TaxID=29358 RepID=UPI00202CB50E|nr:ABC transporter permease [Paeniclostridium ghonii]MCM0167812.1 ABC transporter permease [Paeniclostridium ghonii]
MIENNNKKSINKLAKESFKSNKSRNKFTIIAVALTTLLFTVLFTINMSIIKSSEYSTTRMVGTTFHGALENLTTKEYEKIKKHKLIKEQAICIFVSMAENKEFAKRGVEIKYADESYINHAFSKSIKGRIPKKENEILLDTITLDMLGLPYEINQTINLTYKVDGKEYKKDFVVSGIYEGNVTSFDSVVYTSKDFEKNAVKNLNQEKEKKDRTDVGLISLSVNFSNSLFIEKKLEKIVTDSGLKTHNMNFGINWAYMGGNSSIDLGTIVGVTGIVLLIMFTGYLIIYNIFYISIVKDIKFYGLLKTIGTTKKQIKKIIIKQALILSSIGIPIGMGFGYIIGIVLMPIIMSTLTIEYTKISANPIIFIGSILFSLITVFISAYKPAKIASKVSPVEAVRYSGVSENSKKKIKKTSNRAKLHKMAVSNIFKSKRKTFIAILSLSLSIIILNITYTLVSGFDMDKYLSGSIGTDFTIGDSSFYRWRFDPQNPNAVTNDLCKEIESINGVKAINKMYYREVNMPLTGTMKNKLYELKDSDGEYRNEEIKKMKKSNQILGMYYGIDKGIYELLEKHLIKGNLNVEKFNSGNYIIVQKSYYEDNIGNLDVGDKVVIPFENGEKKEYEVLAIVDNPPLYLYVGYSIGEISNFSGYLPSSEFEKTTSNKSIMTAMFDVDNEITRKKVEYYLESSIKHNPTLDYRSKETYAKEFEDMVKSYETVGYGLSFIIGTIGILNFSNVMITSIVARRKEISMLKSIGMTKKQVKKMIILEGLYYTLITIGVVVIIGLPLTYSVVNLLSSKADIFSYSFRILPILVSSPIILLISVVVPSLCFKNVSKTSIVEALRETD